MHSLSTLGEKLQVRSQPHDRVYGMGHWSLIIKGPPHSICLERRLGSGAYHAYGAGGIYLPVSTGTGSIE
jgi:hypothetical protein